jgi:adenylate cyclase
VSENDDYTELWKSILTGRSRGLERSRRFFSRIPSDPRCKLCSAPYGRPGNILVLAMGGGPSALNRRLCKWCMRQARKHPGGAEVEISVLLVDVRGSTGLAEKTSPEEFSRLIARFYGTATRVIDDHDGIVDKFVGDEVFSLFIPGLAGGGHAAAAIEAAREILEMSRGDSAEPWIAVGAGVHTGVSFVGMIGEGDAADFTALGDTVNTASRLTEVAGVGEIVVSQASAAAAELDTEGLEHRTLTLRGREQAIDAWVVRP